MAVRGPEIYTYDPQEVQTVADQTQVLTVVGERI
jgi:hypothetical protein